MGDLGKAIVAIGFSVVLFGAVLIVAGRWNLPLGRLPGDIAWKSKTGNTQFYFPLATSILVSILLTLLLWIIRAIRK